MPGYDRTGPTGQGPQTGRGLGRCNPQKQTQTPNTLYGNGVRRLFRRARNGRARVKDRSRGKRRGRG